VIDLPAGDPLSGRLTVGLKTSPVDVTWQTLNDLWAAAGELDVFSALWMADHLTDVARDRGGQWWESPTLMAALAHHAPGKWLGHAVLSNTFRLPSLVAKQATVMDHVTAGHYILGMGAGWHEGEHEAFGIPLPPIGERIDRLESAVAVIRALFSEAGRSESGVILDDRFYPLQNAVNDPPPASSTGPPIWLGGQKRRGIALAARAASGWLMPGNRSGDVAYLVDRRDAMLRALDEVGRDPKGFSFAAQVACGAAPADRRVALEQARAFVEVGATHLVLGMAPALGPEMARTIAREIAEPLLAPG
jgi:alkanesulfonate monooxygenase SsuD/methylene tetrahydromethanopterin reductase-like flavin-dependent oxidoreductase (luciferase family)